MGVANKIAVSRILPHFDWQTPAISFSKVGSTGMYVFMGRGGLVVKVFGFGGIDVGSNLVRAAWCPWTRHP